MNGVRTTLKIISVNQIFLEILDDKCYSLLNDIEMRRDLMTMNLDYYKIYVEMIV